MSKRQMRIQTRDNVVIVTVTVFDENGDFDESVRYYGPFESADKQREFMKSVFTDARDDERNRMLKTIDEWRRFDEEPS